MKLERKDLVRALSTHPVTVLNALADELTTECEVKLTSLPQAGLGLLTLADGAFHEPYYLGEFPLSSCSVELIFADGNQAIGGAQVMADNAELARSLAILDAVFATRLQGCEQVERLFESGMQKRTEEESRRRKILAATRVDFSMLNSAENDDDEN